MPEWRSLLERKSRPLLEIAALHAHAGKRMQKKYSPFFLSLGERYSVFEYSLDIVSKISDWYAYEIDILKLDDCKILA